MCTSWWHGSARCYTLLALVRFDTGAPTSTDIGNIQWLSSLKPWTHLWRCWVHEDLLQRICCLISYLSQVCIWCVWNLSFLGSQQSFLTEFARLNACIFEICFWSVHWLLHNLAFQPSFVHQFSYRDLHDTYSSEVQAQAKHRDIQLNFKGDDIHNYTTSQSTDLSGIAVSHAWVYNLMCIPLLTILHSKREMLTCLDMCWMV